MAQPAYTVSSISLVVHTLILVIHRTYRAIRDFRFHKISYSKFWRVTFTALVLVLLAEAAGIPFADKTPTTKQYLLEAENRMSKDTPGTRVSAWLAWFNESQANDTLARHAGQVTTVMPVWYKLGTDAKVGFLASGVSKKDTLSVASNRKLPLMPTIGNDFDPDRVSKLLDSETAKNALVTELVSEAQSAGYAGFDIDWEQIYPGDREGFADLVHQLAAALHERGKRLSIDVPAPTTKGYVSDLDKAFNLARLSSDADEIRVMAYDYHYEGSGPGPVTPLDAFAATVKQEIAAIPAAKLVVGLPTYGYDWNLGSKGGAPIQYDDAIKLVSDNHGSLKRDRHSAALVGHYKIDGLEHVIWLNDAETIKTELAIGRSYGAYQYSVWRLGGEDPDTWNAFK